MNYFNLEYAVQTDIGLVRRENQDAYFPKEQQRSFDTRSAQLFIIADGMGGLVNGHKASQTAIHEIRKYIALCSSNNLPDLMRLAFVAANNAIYEQGQRTSQKLGTTCTAMIIRYKKATIAHVGDTQVYRLRRRNLELLTQDHSNVAEMVRRGLLSEKEAKNHPGRSMLSRALGIAPEIQVDVIEQIDIAVNDIFLMNSDGVRNVDISEIKSIIGKNSPANACSRLIDSANARGGTDNTTAMIIKFIPDMGQNERHKITGRFRLLVKILTFVIICIALFFLFFEQLNLLVRTFQTGSKIESSPNVSQTTRTQIRVDSLLNSAQHFVALRDLDRALQDYDAVLVDSPLNLDALNGKEAIYNALSNEANSLFAQRLYSEALVVFEKALNLRPGNSSLIDKMKMTTQIVTQKTQIQSRNYLDTMIQATAKKISHEPTNGDYQTVELDGASWLFNGSNGQDYMIENSKVTFAETPLRKMAIRLDPVSQMEVSADITFSSTEGAGKLGFIIGYSIDDRGSKEAYHLFSLSRDGTMSLEKMNGNGVKTLIVAPMLSTSELPLQTAKLKIRCIGPWLHCFVDDRLISPWLEEVLIEGKIGLYASPGTTGTFSGFKIVKILP